MGGRADDHQPRRSGLNPRRGYEDRLVRTPDGWRIAHRRFTMVHFATIGD